MPKTPEAPSIESLDGEFQVRTVTLRKKKYVLKELSASQYQKCLKLARLDEEDPDEALFKLMLDKAIIEPKGVSVEKIYNGPFTVVQRLNEILREMHFTPAADESTDEDEETGGEA